MTAEHVHAPVSCAAGGPTYADYLRLDVLLQAQRPLSAERAPAIHDEHFFIVLHQAQELWFKQLLHEIDALRRLDPRDAAFFARALPGLERIAAIQDSLVRQLELLRTLDATQFMALRPRLGTASGAQSLQFRLLQATVGATSPGALRKDAASLPPPDRERLERTLEEPTLHDIVVRALTHEAERGGVAAARGAAACDGRGYGALPEAAARLVDRLGREAGNAPVRLALDALCRFEDSGVAWREAHMGVVRDLLDQLPGTGGTSGHAYLRARLASTPRSALWRAWRLASRLAVVRTHVVAGGVLR